MPYSVPQTQFNGPDGIKEKLFRIWYQERLDEGERPYLSAETHMFVFPEWLKNKFGILVEYDHNTKMASWVFASKHDMTLFMLQWA